MWGTHSAFWWSECYIILLLFFLFSYFILQSLLCVLCRHWHSPDGRVQLLDAIRLLLHLYTGKRLTQEKEHDTWKILNLFESILHGGGEDYNIWNNARMKVLNYFILYGYYNTQGVKKGTTTNKNKKNLLPDINLVLILALRNKAIWSRILWWAIWLMLSDVIYALGVCTHRLMRY